MLVLVNFPDKRVVSFDICDEQPLKDLESQLCQRLGCAPAFLSSMYIAGRHGLGVEETFASSALPWLTLRGRVLGGKGGFGSTLRSQGNKVSKKKPANYDNCRDIYGRRLKTLKDAKAIVDRAEATEKAKEEARECRRKKIADGLLEKSAKKHRFDDVDYINESEEIVEATRAVARKALKKGKKSNEAGAADAQTHRISMAIPLFDGNLDGLSSSSDEEDAGSGNKSTDSGDPPQPEPEQKELSISASTSTQSAGDS
ncbi:hypothetical protein GGF40_002345 [Coemansia sp. RSA 1286]|nr:hypothetical protein GGF40_002345 [Coemansia sp. RSA 1286]